jgi:hypothetical protein
MNSDRPDLTKSIADVSVKFIVREPNDLLDLLGSMGRGLIALTNPMNTLCYPLVLTLSLTMVDSSDSTES